MIDAGLVSSFGSFAPPAAFPVVPPRRGAFYAAPRTARSIAEQLGDDASTFDFFQAVLLLERLNPESRPVGRQGSPALEAVRFRAYQSLGFPASSIQEIVLPTGERAQATMEVNFLGLTGPSGVLPRHYTETLLQAEREHSGSNRRVLRDWLDLFNHRLVSLFFRAWEKYRFYIPYARGEADRIEPDACTASLLSLAGLGLASLRNRLRVSTWDGVAGSQRERVVGEVPDLAMVRYAGLLAQRPRSAVNLQALLADYFGLPTTIQQFVGQWLILDEGNQSRVQSGAGNNRLGVDTVLGDRVWDVQSKLRVRLGPLTYRQFADLLPDLDRSQPHPRFFLVSQLARLFLGPELDFEVQLVLRADEVPGSRLSHEATAPRLGWNAWLTNEPRTHDADDAAFAASDGRWLAIGG